MLPQLVEILSIHCLCKIKLIYIVVCNKFELIQLIFIFSSDLSPIFQAIGALLELHSVSSGVRRMPFRDYVQQPHFMAMKDEMKFSLLFIYYFHCHHRVDRFYDLISKLVVVIWIAAL